MQSYYYIKMKCMIIRIMEGTFLLICGIGILIAIVREMLNSFHDPSRLAYGLGIVLCAVMIMLGLFMFYQSMHFERCVFGTKNDDYKAFTDKDQSQDEALKDFVVSDKLILSFSFGILNMCTLIRTEDIIGCFEDPVYGTIESPGESSLTVYTKKFKQYVFTFSGKNVEDGHRAMMKIAGILPWIYMDGQEAFLDQMVSKAGRRELLHTCEKREHEYKNQK